MKTVATEAHTEAARHGAGRAEAARACSAFLINLLSNVAGGTGKSPGAARPGTKASENGALSGRARCVGTYAARPRRPRGRHE